MESYAYDDAAEVSSTIDIIPAWPASPLIIAGWALDEALAPTAAYMAYANHQEHLRADAAEMLIGSLLVFQPTDLFWHEHVEHGRLALRPAPRRQRL